MNLPTRQRARPARTEQPIHIAIVDYLRAVLRPGYLALHIPMNAATKTAGAIAKAMGALAGVADILILCPDARCAWLEVKKAGGRQHAEQVEFASWCRRHGHVYGVARSIDEARAFLASVGIPTREAA